MCIRDRSNSITVDSLISLVTSVLLLNIVTMNTALDISNLILTVITVFTALIKILNPVLFEKRSLVAKTNKASNKIY